jgi:hypothetical protein
MAIRGPISVPFEVAFPAGALARGAIEAVPDYDASTKERPVQQRDKTSGLPVWRLSLIDQDPDARRGQELVSVKFAAAVPPTLPADVVPGTELRAVELIGLAVIPYVESKDLRGRLAYSMWATGLRAAAKPSGRPSAPIGQIGQRDQIA